MHIRDTQFNYIVKALTSHDGNAITYVRQITIPSYIEDTGLDRSHIPDNEAIANYLTTRLLTESNIDLSFYKKYVSVLRQGLNTSFDNLNNQYVKVVGNWLKTIPLGSTDWDDNTINRLKELSGEELDFNSVVLWLNYVALVIINYISKYETVLEKD